MKKVNVVSSMRRPVLVSSAILLISGCVTSQESKFASFDGNNTKNLESISGTWKTMEDNSLCHLVLEVSRIVRGAGEFSLLRTCENAEGFLEKTTGTLSLHTNSSSYFASKRSSCSAEKAVPFKFADISLQGEMLVLTSNEREIRLIRMKDEEKKLFARQYVLGCQVKGSQWKPYALADVY